MGVIEGSATAEINAPIERCYEIAADIDHIAEWQQGVEAVEAVERDGDGNVTLAKIKNDAKVRVVEALVEFSHAQRPQKFTWRQKKGDLKSLDGSWTFEDTGNGTTRATYHLVGDPGRMLGMMIRGPVEGKIRDFLVKSRPEELKRRAEAG